MAHFHNIDAIKTARAVMIVSDARCVDALQTLYGNDMAIIAWVDQAEIPDALLSKKIILWPDNDALSIHSMRTLAAKINARLESANVNIVNTDGLPAKYNVADFISEGNGRAAIEAFVKPRLAAWDNSAPVVTAPIKKTSPVTLVNQVLTIARNICTDDGFTMNDMMGEMNISFNSRSDALMDSVYDTLTAAGYVREWGRAADGAEGYLWKKK